MESFSESSVSDELIEAIDNPQLISSIKTITREFLGNISINESLIKKLVKNIIDAIPKNVISTYMLIRELLQVDNSFVYTALNMYNGNCETVVNKLNIMKFIGSKNTEISKLAKEVACLLSKNSEFNAIFKDVFELISGNEVGSISEITTTVKRAEDDDFVSHLLILTDDSEDSSLKDKKLKSHNVIPSQYVITKKTKSETKGKPRLDEVIEEEVSKNETRVSSHLSGADNGNSSLKEYKGSRNKKRPEGEVKSIVVEPSIEIRNKICKNLENSRTVRNSDNTKPTRTQAIHRELQIQKSETKTYNKSNPWDSLHSRSSSSSSSRYSDLTDTSTSTSTDDGYSVKLSRTPPGSKTDKGAVASLNNNSDGKYLPLRVLNHKDNITEFLAKRGTRGSVNYTFSDTTPGSRVLKTVNVSKEEDKEKGGINISRTITTLKERSIGHKKEKNRVDIYLGAGNSRPIKSPKGPKVPNIQGNEIRIPPHERFEYPSDTSSSSSSLTSSTEQTYSTTIRMEKHSSTKNDRKGKSYFVVESVESTTVHIKPPEIPKCTKDSPRVLISIDDNPQNNQEMLKVAEEYGTIVKTFSSSIDFIKFAVNNYQTLQSYFERQDKIRFMTDRSRVEEPVKITRGAKASEAVQDNNAHMNIINEVRNGLGLLTSKILIYTGSGIGRIRNMHDPKKNTYVTWSEDIALSFILFDEDIDFTF